MALIYAELVAIVDDVRLMRMHCFIQGNEDESLDPGN